VLEIDVREPPPAKPDLPPPPEMPKRPSGPLQGAARDAYNAAMDQYRRDLEEYRRQVDEIERAFEAAVQNYKDNDTVYTEGFVGLVAFAYSGSAECGFKNAWLWKMNP
jgi:uncharacterized protein YukE